MMLCHLFLCFVDPFLQFSSLVLQYLMQDLDVLFLVSATCLLRHIKFPAASSHIAHACSLLTCRGLRWQFLFWLTLHDCSFGLLLGCVCVAWGYSEELHLHLTHAALVSIFLQSKYGSGYWGLRPLSSLCRSVLGVHDMCVECKQQNNGRMQATPNQI
jgi:hypothetical protein